MAVTAQYLLEGCAYALEQCGVLLCDAAALLKNGSPPSIVTLATFAREELGRSGILFDLYVAVQNGAEVNEQDIRKKCGDHVEKQKRAQLSVMQRFPLESRAGEFTKIVFTAKADSDEYRSARKALDVLEEQKAKRTPHDRHNARMQALYVEPSGSSWNRPVREITKESARDSLIEVINDYMTFLQGQPDSPRNLAFQAWSGCPSFPMPTLDFFD
jgi:AbiV family abortive infection protein